MLVGNKSRIFLYASLIVTLVLYIMGAAMLMEEDNMILWIMALGLVTLGLLISNIFREKQRRLRAVLLTVGYVVALPVSLFAYLFLLTMYYLHV